MRLLNKYFYFIRKCPTTDKKIHANGTFNLHLFVTQLFNAVGTRADKGSYLFCLLSSEGQQIVSRVHLQCAALTETDAPRPHRVHHVAATLSQVPQAHLHVPALTAPINAEA